MHVPVLTVPVDQAIVPKTAYEQFNAADYAAKA